MIDLKNTKFATYDRRIKINFFSLTILFLASLMFFSFNNEALQSLYCEKHELIKKIKKVERKNLQKYYKLSYINEILEGKSSKTNLLTNDSILKTLNLLSKRNKVRVTRFHIARSGIHKDIETNFNSYKIDLSLSSAQLNNIPDFLIEFESALKGINFIKYLSIYKQNEHYLSTAKIALLINKKSDLLNLRKLNYTKF